MSGAPLRIGITCNPTAGGSGIVATGIGLEMARRGHHVHFVCTDLPRRLPALLPDRVRFHPVRAREYPVFPTVPYSLALASMLVAVTRAEGLDIIHAHYAVPHATSAWMAREVLGDGAPWIVTTLHGTDITLVGSDDSYLPITRHSILKSDALTAPSASLRVDTYARLGLDPASVPIEVVPNFVDTERFHPGFRRGAPPPGFRRGAPPPGSRRGAPPPGFRRGAPPPGSGEVAPVIVHASNFRPVKRIADVVRIFARVAADRPARLLLIGDGPDRPAAEAQIAALGLTDRVRLVGEQDDVSALLRGCAAFLLPSERESFGLAALEALASGVPVVASAVGGLPEVVLDGETGFLCAPDDLEGMAARVGALLDDPGLRRTLGAAARADAVARFRLEPTVDRYEALYRRLGPRGR
jgi:glycosyltransferase involved in cell wall biosynthesis